MHREFISKYPSKKCSYSIYRREVSELRISFTKLGEEQCEKCVENLQRAHVHDLEINKELECAECLVWNWHITRAMEARTCYREDAEKKWSNEYSVRSADLQKVIMLPRLPRIKTAVFTKRIVAFHQTFAGVGTSKAAKKCKRNNISVV